MTASLSAPGKGSHENHDPATDLTIADVAGMQPRLLREPESEYAAEYRAADG